MKQPLNLLEPHKEHRNIVFHIEAYVVPSVVCYVAMWFHLKIVRSG
jgi:hypothetical protein